MEAEVCRDTVERCQPSLGEGPEAFDAVLQGKRSTGPFPDLSDHEPRSSRRPLAGPPDAQVTVVADIGHPAAGAPSIRDDRGLDSDPAAAKPLKYWLVRVGDDLGEDLAPALEAPEDRLFQCAAAGLEPAGDAAGPGGAEVACVDPHPADGQRLLRAPMGGDGGAEPAARAAGSGPADPGHGRRLRGRRIGNEGPHRPFPMVAR